MKKAQLGTKVPESIVEQVLADASEFSRTKDGIVQAALQNHFLFKKEERRRIYSSIPKKIFGRPLKINNLYD